jgi:hypothetical protein
LKDIARERGTNTVVLGHPENAKPLKEAPPYPPLAQ